MKSHQIPLTSCSSVKRQRKVGLGQKIFFFLTQQQSAVETSDISKVYRYWQIYLYTVCIWHALGCVYLAKMERVGLFLNIFSITEFCVWPPPRQTIWTRSLKGHCLSFFNCLIRLLISFEKSWKVGWAALGGGWARDISSYETARKFQPWLEFSRSWEDSCRLGGFFPLSVIRSSERLITMANDCLSQIWVIARQPGGKCSISNEYQLFGRAGTLVFSDRVKHWYEP